MRRIYVESREIVSSENMDAYYEYSGVGDIEYLYCFIQRFTGNIDAVKLIPVEIEGKTGNFYISESFHEIEDNDILLKQSESSVEYKHKIIGRLKYSNQAIYEIERK